MTRQTWEEERDAELLKHNERLLKHIVLLLEEILKRLPPTPKFRPTNGIAVIVDPVQPTK